jgi:MerR family transcriptional regulator, copper efflux regulator
MDTMTIQEVERQTGLSGPTLRYYEQVGLIGPIARDGSSGHRRYDEGDLDALQALACLRAMGVGIEDMRTYQANRLLGNVAAADQRDLLTRHARRIESEIGRLQVHLRYLEGKAALWDARARGDADGERSARQQVEAILPELAGALR